MYNFYGGHLSIVSTHDWPANDLLPGTRGMEGKDSDVPAPAVDSLPPCSPQAMSSQLTPSPKSKLSDGKQLHQWATHDEQALRCLPSG